MSLFEAAWDLILKAPIYNEHGEVIPHDVIYSGGDKDDDVRYATSDFDQALAYALFGSAVGDLPPHIEGGVPGGHGFALHGRNRPPLRQTRPAIWQTRNTPDQDFHVITDTGGNKGSFIFDEGQNPQEQMSDDDVEYYINDKLEEMFGLHDEKNENQIPWDEPAGFGYQASETSADNYFPEEQAAHMRDAIKRLKGELPYRDVLTAEMMPHLGTAWRDQFEQEMNNKRMFGDFDTWFEGLHPLEKETAHALMSRKFRTPFDWAKGEKE